MADVEMQDASSAKDKAVKTSKNAAGEGAEGKKRFEVKKVNTTFLLTLSFFSHINMSIKI